MSKTVYDSSLSVKIAVKRSLVAISKGVRPNISYAVGEAPKAIRALVH